jgi:uncharacterized protein
MPDRAAIDDFLAQTHLAFVGVSRDPKNFANTVYRQLRDGGRVLYPVNGNATSTTLEGDRCYGSVADVPDPVDGVVVMVKAAVAQRVVRDAIRRGIPRVWLHRGVGPGSVSAEAVELCRQAGVSVIDGACPLMFEEPVRSLHRVHRFLSRRRFAA